jgi:D-alanyl-lipoteichoic acid acyltransferase DltB (MBOAT superfamily)
MSEAIYRSARVPTKRSWLTLAIVGDLGALAWFKYYGFFATSIRNGLADLGMHVHPPLLQVVLPIGISFFTFQALSYVLDTWRGLVKPVPFLDFATYLSFFPHLVAGPIVRASEFLPQLRQRPDRNRIDSARAFRLIMQGMFKKVVVASFLASAIVDPVFGSPRAHTRWEILIAIYGYAIQIYADFSGYTDIAIGLALLLGFQFPQNFNAPYIARSLQDFWRRWHMTLSRFLRDYLYVPLGGNRNGNRRTYRNLMLTMVIGGLWHGANWTFVVWGAIHGGALALERLWADQKAGDHARARRAVAVPAVVSWLVTFHVVCLAWVFFRAPTFSDAGTLLTRLFTAGGPAPLVTPLVLFTIVAMLASQFVNSDTIDILQARFSRLAPSAQGVALASGFAVIDALGPVGVAPFIYFRF